MSDMFTMNPIPYNSNEQAHVFQIHGFQMVALLWDAVEFGWMRCTPLHPSLISAHTALAKLYQG